MSPKKTKPPVQPDPADDAATRAIGDLVSSLEDPHTHEFLKTYLGITDEQLKAHIRRLIQEAGVHGKPEPKK